MKLVEKSLLYYMSKETFILNDDCLDIESSSLFFRRKMTYKYEVIEPRFGEGAIGDAGWSVLAGIFFWSGLVSLFIFIIVSYITGNKFLKPVGNITMLLLWFLAACSFLMRFVKREGILVYDKNNNFITFIRITTDSQTFIEEFKRRVEAASAGSTK